MNHPWRVPSTAILVVAMLLVGCGGGGGGGGGGGDGGEELPDRAEATSEDPEGTTYPLREGRYRLSYRAPDCDDPVITITGEDGTVVYDQHPRTFTSFINDVPAGTYTITVSDDCDGWSVDLVEF